MRAASREFVPKARFVVNEEGMFVRWKIILPTETLIDILSFCSRRILSKRMRLVNRQFMRICNENIHSVGTVFNLTVAITYKYDWVTRSRDYVRDFIRMHCCMHTSDSIPRVAGVETKFNLQLQGAEYECESPRWARGLKGSRMFFDKEKTLTPAEFYRFMQTNRYVRFANLTFENVQEECVIEFFKYLIETTEMFDHCRFFVKFKHTPKHFKAKAQVVHVQIPLDVNVRYVRTRVGYVVGCFDEDDCRTVGLDEFIPVNSIGL